MMGRIAYDRWSTQVLRIPLRLCISCCLGWRDAIGRTYKFGLWIQSLLRGIDLSLWSPDCWLFELTSRYCLGVESRITNYGSFSCVFSRRFTVLIVGC